MRGPFLTFFALMWNKLYCQVPFRLYTNIKRIWWLTFALTEISQNYIKCYKASRGHKVWPSWHKFCDHPMLIFPAEYWPAPPTWLRFRSPCRWWGPSLLRPHCPPPSPAHAPGCPPQTFRRRQLSVHLYTVKKLLSFIKGFYLLGKVIETLKYHPWE